MSIRKALGMAGVLAFAAIPVVSQADRSRAALDACVNSFVETYIPKDRAVRVRLPRASGPLVATYASHTYTIALTAREARSGELLAQARCVASVSGEIIVLDSPPIESYIARADFSAVVRQ